MSLKPFIDMLEKLGKVEHVGNASLYYEAALKEAATNNTIYINPKEINRPIIANVLNSQEKVALALNCKIENIYTKFLSSVQQPKPLTTKKWTGYTKLKTLDELPIVTHFEKDLGPYITSSIIVAHALDESFSNMSVHRIRSLGVNRGVIRMVEGRHLHTIFNMKKNEDLKIAIIIGVHPAVELAAAYQAPWGTNELEIAQSLMDGKLSVVRTPQHGILVPEAEYIIEGRILKSEMEDDMMTEILGNYDHKRKQPIVLADAIWSKPNPLYWDVLPGGLEHKWLMGFPVESKLNKAVKDAVPNTTKVILTEGGSKWLHAVIQLRKRLEGEPKNAMMAAFSAHPSLKSVTVVDEDIDPNDPLQVEYALATRFQAGDDILIIRKAKGSSLDPSSDQERLITDKLGLDATKPLDKNSTDFERAKIPMVGS